MDRHPASDDWINKYYERITAERRVSLERRDRVTHWSYMVLGVFVGAYVALMVNGTSSFWRFALTATILAIMTRFFFQSAIAYGFFLRHRYIQTEIEKHWMDNLYIEHIKKVIREFDHGKHIPSTKKKIVVGQLRSGPLGLVLPVLLLAIDFVSGVWYCVVLMLLVVYVSYEIVNYVKYDQMKVRF